MNPKNLQNIPKKCSEQLLHKPKKINDTIKTPLITTKFFFVKIIVNVNYVHCKFSVMSKMIALNDCLER